jgi:hypothetical protein
MNERWADNQDSAICAKRDYLRSLHGDTGGPMCCLLCIGKWHAEHGRRRRLGRIVIRAMVAFLAGGGKSDDLNMLMLSAIARDIGVFRQSKHKTGHPYRRLRPATVWRRKRPPSAPRCVCREGGVRPTICRSNEERIW